MDDHENLSVRPRSRRLLPNGKSRWIVATATCAVIGLAAACGTSAAATSPAPTSSNSAPANARSGPAAGGAAGTVSNVTTSGFTLTTATGQQATIDETATTAYQNGTSSTTASAITSGDDVLVLGTTNGTTITATQVTVQPAGTDTAAAAAAAGVVAFQQGAQSTAKQAGQIPANYTEGSGTIVSGTTANQATEAALAAYPGGVVDRVVQLSNGEYEVHNIGVNWPHHVFVSQDFQVLGAD
jgi:hypothetical protein